MTTLDQTATDGGTALPAQKDRLAPGDGLIIGLLMLSTFIVLLNEMMLGVALPTLIADLRITPTTGQWVTTGYLLTLAVLIPATGFVMRRLHLRTVFLGSMSIFAVGTAICAFAPTFGVLLGGRLIQAVGTAVFMPLLMTTAMRLIPVSRRGQIMALVVAVPAIAPAVGPGMSGFVLSQLSWRWLFLVILPIALGCLVLGALKLRNITTPERVTLDALSLVLSAVGFGALVYGLASIGESVSGHAPVPPALPILVGLFGVAAFARRQTRLQRRDAALLDMRIFGSGTFSVALLIMLVIAMNGFGTAIVLPLVLTAVYGLSPLEIGLFLVPSGAMIALVSALGGRVYDRVGARPLAVPGALVWTAALWVLSRIDDTTSTLTVFLAFLVMSGAQAAMWAPVTTTALAGLRAELYPHGTAAFTTAQQLAGAAGGAVLISAYTIGANASQVGGTLSTSQAVSAAQSAFTTAAVIATAAVIGTLFLVKPTVHEDVAETATSAPRS